MIFQRIISSEALTIPVVHQNRGNEAAIQAVLAWDNRSESIIPAFWREQSSNERQVKILYEARLSDLGSDDFVKVECTVRTLGAVAAGRAPGSASASAVHRRP